MQRILLPVIGSALVVLAAGGVVFGVLVQEGEEAESAPVVGAVAGETGARDSGLGQPAAGDSARQAGVDDFIRFGVAEAPAKAPGAVRLATYNVENLFDAVDDPALSGRDEDIDDAKPEAELTALAATIRELDADILALEEVESEAVVRWFRDTYLADAGYEYLVSVEAGDARGIEQAILSRYPVRDVTNWPGRELGGTHPETWGSGENWNAGEPIRFHRSPLRARVEIPAEGGGAYELTVYVVHAKSGGPGEYWRQKEASGLVEILERESRPGENIAILGDFNAMLTDGSVQTLVGAGFADALGDVYTPGARYTTHESGRRIDYILVNPALASELVAGSGFVLGTPALPEGVDWREEWRPEGYASDHYPVAVDLLAREGSSGG